MFDVYFSQKNKKSNSTFRFDWQNVDNCACHMKETTSVIRPTLEITGGPETFAGNQYPRFSLAYIPVFNRYYFVRDYRTLSATQWEIDLEVDTLATYKEDLLAARAFIQYAQSSYNTYLIDSRFPTHCYANSIEIRQRFTPYDEQGCCVIGVVTSNSQPSLGSSSPFLVGRGGMGALGKWLTDNLAELSLLTTDVASLFTSAVWLPVGNPGLPQVEIEILGKGTGISGSPVATSRLRGSQNISIPLFTASDGRPLEQQVQKMTSTTELYLPGVGYINIEQLLGNTSSALLGTHDDNVDIIVSYEMDYISGNITYEIYGEASADFITVAGELGQAIPFYSAMSMNTYGVLQGANQTITSAFGILASFATGNAGGMVSSAGSANSGLISEYQALNQKTIATGKLTGGIAATQANSEIKILRTLAAPSDYHSNCSPIIGAPVMKVDRVGNYSGYVKVTNCYPILSDGATGEEWELFDALVNGQGTIMSGAKQGGIYIE